MKAELTDIRLLSLLSVLPLMLLGVWIISNESFANLSSRSEKYSRVIRVESLGHKASRVRDIGIYFLILSAATIALYLLIAIWPEQIPASLLLLSILALFLALLRKRADTERRVAVSYTHLTLPTNREV